MKKFLSTITKRVKAGRTSPAEESKVKVALINSRIELEQAAKTIIIGFINFKFFAGNNCKTI